MNGGVLERTPYATMSHNVPSWTVFLFTVNSSVLIKRRIRSRLVFQYDTYILYYSYTILACIYLVSPSATKNLSRINNETKDYYFYFVNVVFSYGGEKKTFLYVMYSAMLRVKSPVFHRITRTSWPGFGLPIHGCMRLHRSERNVFSRNKCIMIVPPRVAEW